MMSLTLGVSALRLSVNVAMCRNYTYTTLIVVLCKDVLLTLCTTAWDFAFEMVRSKDTTPYKIIVKLFYTRTRLSSGNQQRMWWSVRCMKKPRIYPSSLMTYLASEPCPQGPLVELSGVVGHRIVESAPEFW